MNLEKQLGLAHSRQNALLIRDYVGNSPARFDQLMSFFFHSEYRLAQRAAHAVSYCTDRFPDLAQPHVGKMIANLALDPGVAIRRNTVRILQHQYIPEDYQGLLVEKCFHYLLSRKETVAVKAFAMTLLYELSRPYPDLQKELKMVIEDLLPTASSGLKNRGQKILNLLLS